MVKKEQIDIMLEGIKRGNNITDSCKLAGINQKTYHQWMKNSPEKREQIEKARTEFKAWCIAVVMKAAQTQAWQAAAWLLERKYSDEYGRKEKREIEGNVNIGLNIHELHKMARKIKRERKAILEQGIKENREVDEDRKD